MFIEVPKVPTEDFQASKSQATESSQDIRKRVQKARDKQVQRFQGTSLSSNSEMGSKDIKIYCQLESEGEGILAQAVQTLHLSARAYYRILKLARTIADLADSDRILTSHLLEALSYRKKEE